MEQRLLLTGGAGNANDPGEFYYSLTSAGNLSNSDNSRMWVDDSDIVKLTIAEDGSWRHEVFFDGSDVGLNHWQEDIDAFAIRQDGTILVSTVGWANVPGVRDSDSSDLLQFHPTSTGQHTTGTWSLFVDGSDLGLSHHENIDAVAELDDGSLVISTQRNSSLPGIGNVRDEDLSRVQLTSTGVRTRGQWSRYFDGSDVGLHSSHENIDGVSVGADGETVLLSTTGTAWVPGLAAKDEDVFAFEASRLGSHTSGQYASGLTLNASRAGISSSYDIDAFHAAIGDPANPQPPVIEAISNQSIDEETTLSFTADATDPDTSAEDLEWSLVNGPSTATVNPATGVFSWTPTESDGPGTFEVTLAVSDGELSDTETFLITVNEVNTAPVLTPIADRSVSAGSVVSFDAEASDVDLPANTLVYSLSGDVPPGSAFDTATGQFEWNTTSASSGNSYDVIVSVSDGEASDSESFRIIVDGSGILVDSIPDQSVNELEPFAYQVVATGDSGDLQDIDFETAGGGGLNAGDIITHQFAALGIHVTTHDPNRYPAMIFDSSEPTGHDYDLGTPNSRFGGPGIGHGGKSGRWQNDVARHNVLIISEDGDSSDPDDRARGGKLIFTFDTPTDIDDIRLLDVDSGRNTIRFYDAAGQKIGSKNIPRRGNNSVQKLTLDMERVSRMEVSFSGSGAITDLIFDRDGQGQSGGPLTYALDESAPQGMTISDTGLIEWIPTEAQGPEIYAVIVLVSDGTSTVQTTYQVSVAEVNVVPLIEPIADRSVDELSAFGYQVIASDTDLPANILAFSLADGAPDGMSITETGLIEWTPEEAQGPGAYSVTVEVSDGTEVLTEDFQISVGEVNSAPTITLIEDQSINELVLFQQQVQVTDTDLPENSLSFALADGAPDGMAISDTGLIEWTPTEVQGPDSYPVTVVVSDGTTTASESFTLNVAEVNSAPTITLIEDQSINELALFQQQVQVTDSDLPENSLSFALADGAPDGMTISDTGLIEWTPSEAQGPDSYPVTVVVSDGTTTASESFTLNVVEVNSAPELVTIPNQSINEENLWTLETQATDSDLPANELTYSLTGTPPTGTPPTGIAIDADGILRWTPAESQGPGTYSITIEVSDGQLTDSQTFTITVNEINRAPQISPIADLQRPELTSIQIQVDASDPDFPANSLSYELLTPIPAGMSIDANGVILWLPSEAQGPDDYNVSVQVSDGSLSAIETFTLIVTEQNQAPVLAGIGNLTAFPGSQLMFDANANATDADLPANTLSYAIDGDVPAGASIDSESGLITWDVPANETLGERIVTVTVSDQNGAFDSETFAITVEGPVIPTITLSEDDRFSTEVNRTLVLPNDASAVQVTFQAPEFDTSAQQSIRDAFEIEVTDTAGNPLSFPYASDRDVVYNWTENLGPVFGVGTSATTNPTGQDSTAKINLSGLPAGTEVVVTARLVNNDFDTGTSVRIQSLDVVDAGGAAPTGFSPTPVPVRSLGPVDLNRLSDITASFTTAYGRTTLAGGNRELATELIVTNQGNRTVIGRLLVAIDNISELDAYAMRPDGFLPDGRPYFDVTAEIDGEALAPGETLRAREIRFLNDSGQQFSYRLSVLGEINTAPTGFVSIPLTKIEANRSYRYRSSAIDPEGQTLTYSVTAGPETMMVDPITGLITWPTTATDIGQNLVTLRATDPYGLFVEQRFAIEVVQTLQNRPPNFITDPVTDAIASSGFEITTVAAGAGPTGVAVIDGFRGPGLVTLNAGDQSLSQIDSLGNDLFDLPTQVSVGEPAPTGQVLRSGYSVDVGLPAFENTQDRNQISGMDQADLNGDGTLDLVVSAFSTQWNPSRTYQQLVNVTLGNPDGTFGEAITVAEFTATSNSKFSTLRVADFDSDGRFDILTMDRQTSMMHFLRGDGQGGFADAVSTTLTTNLYHFKTVDLDQDGNLDLVGISSTQRELGYLLGRGDGTFNDFTTIYGDPTGPLITLGQERSYAVADMDGDGDLDAVLSSYYATNITVLSNDGDLNFSVAATLDSFRPNYPYSGTVPSGRPNTVVVGDFNGDSNVDIAYTAKDGASSRTGGLGVYLGDGSGETFAYQDAASNLVIFGDNAAGNGDPVDIDNDGDLDIVLGSSSSSNYGRKPSVLNNQGDGTFVAINFSVPVFGEAPFEFTNNEGNAKGVLVGDYNQDGLLDISTYRSQVASSFASVTVVLADRPGVFASDQNLLFGFRGNSPQVFFEAGDFNNDGIVDLWSPSYQSSSSTWLGRGDSTFEDPFPATPSIGNEGLASGFVDDFNQDGILDVFWIGSNGVQGGPAPRYLAALGNGDGTFEITFQETFIGSGTRRADWSDFNGDGYLDFASTNGNSVHVFLYDVDNPGTWVFDNELLVSDLGAGALGQRFAMSIDDFDQDGKSDIAVVARLPDEPFRMVVYPGVGDGTFTSPVSSFFADSVPNYSSPNWMSTGDFNEDGIPDVAVYEYFSISVHQGVGDGTFYRTDIYPAWRTGTSETQLFVRDINQDGHDDILFTDWAGSQSLGIMLGNGDGSFQDRIAYDLPFVGGFVSFGDFDNDGREDIVASSRGGESYATILNGARERLTDIVSVDLNGDGNDDVLATNTDNSRVKWFLGDNLGNLNRQPDLFTDFGPVALTVSDLDRNGVAEIITANRSARSISMFSGGVGNWTRNDIPVGQAPIDVLSGFVDSDAEPDLLVIDESNNALWVLTGNGDTTFSVPVAVPLGDRPNAFLLADVDADGNNDVVISLPESNRIMILPGDGGGSFAAPQYVAFAGSPSAFAAVDFNQDGHLDLSATLSDLDQVAIIYGRGQFQFARPQLISVGDNPIDMSAEDADDDGRIDLIVTNQGDDTLSVIYNRFDPNEVYRYDSDAIDPDDDPLTYSIVDGPGGLIINSETGALLWAASPDQVGENSVTLSADDGRGGVATQSYKIDVQPARDNATPLFATEAETTFGANEVFTYQATALDNDNDAIRYRLLDGPEDATIDPTTGLVTWDGRGEALKFREFGENGFVQVAADESYQTPSVTVEGWFNIHTLTASNGAALLFKQQNRFDNAYYLRMLFNNQLQFTTRYEDEIVSLRVPFIQEPDRWYHIALTIDDASHTATIYVDGEVIGETALPFSTTYEGDYPLQVTGGQATVDNFRVWSVARSQAEIQQGMAEQYDDNPLVTIDYRFDGFLPHDSSSYRNDGYLLPSPVAPQPNAGLADPGERSFTISVEDGRGGFNTQTFVVQILPEQRGSIAGHLFDDLNGDGDQDDGSEAGVQAEPSLEGWQIYIDSNGNSFPDPSELQTVTESSGNYSFDGLLPSDYLVKVSAVAGYQTPGPFEVAVVANEAAANDLAIEQLSLSHVRGQLKTEDDAAIAYWNVFADLDSDGKRSDDEPTATSDRNGDYALTGLDAGTYTIRPELPAGWADTAGRDGLSVTLAIDEIFSGNDFVLEPTNTSVAGGVNFVTTPPTLIEARQTLRYASVAMSITDEAIVYDLSLAPEGMVVDPRTGLTAWRPTIDQVGEHLVILRATNASGSISLHDLTVEVTEPNTAPTIVRGIGILPVESTAYVGLTYSHEVIAQDAELTTLAYAFTQAPAGASVDSTSGRINWTPAASAVGSRDFTVQVTDEAGATTSATWTVDVENTAPAVLPLVVTLPRSTAAVTTDYFSRIAATDQLDRPVDWSLVSGPAGLTVEANGTILWTPAISQLGTQAVQLTATTADNSAETVSFSIDVIGRAFNAVPVIESTPITSIALGQPYEYDLQVTDSDRDIFAFTLLEAPVGMSVHPSFGTIRWTPNADQLGESNIVIQVSDPSGDTDQQSFKLKVSRFGGPPRLTSVPPTEASVGNAFLYSVEAIDHEGDPLTYTLLAAPTGLSIVETTGEIAWTPTAGQLGQQDVVIQVSDGIGGAVTQAFVIRVSAGAPNLPPVITSTSPRFGSVGMEYSYSLVATDPESTTITYSLGRGPTGMTVDASTGLVSWTPTTGQTGKFVVTLVATDEDGASAIESFEFDVLAQNTAPVISSTAPVNIAAGTGLMYDVLASDADLDQLAFELTAAPVGATIDSFGRIRWQTEVANIGLHDFTVKVTDPRGGEATQSFSVDVIEDVIAPQLSAILSPGESPVGNIPWGSQFKIFVRAIDNVAIASLTLKANGQDIPLDAAGTAEFTFARWGFSTITAIATAVDTNGNTTTKTNTFAYDFPQGWDGAGVDDIPTAMISSPADTAAVTGMVSIVGTASHDDFAAYKLSYRRVDESVFTEFFESTTAVTNGELGVWDTSLLPNDEYVIRLEVAATTGAVNVVEHSVGLAGELKLGNFRLSFTDMVIPVAGIPIEITRIYDTLQADVEGDFGFGWRLEFRDTDLRVGLPESGLEDIGIYSPLRPGVKVHLNVPGEGRQGFTFNPDIRILPGFGTNNLVLARPRFVPDPGVTSTLSTGTSGYLIVNESGELFAPGNLPYNPASPYFGGAYVVTTQTGVSYRIDGGSGKLLTAADPNDNQLSFTEEGIQSDVGRAISFTRDAQGRIVSIENDNEESYQYQYNTSGSLQRVTDPSGNESQYLYDSLRPNYLTDVIDPLGNTGIRAEYDEDGRIISVTDPNGNSLDIATFIGTSSQELTDALGNETRVQFDDLGNVASETDALGNQTLRTHDASGNVTRVTDPLGRSTVFTYDGFRNILTQTTPDGGVTRFDYVNPIRGLIGSITNPQGQTTRFEYDSRGNLLRTIIADGSTQSSQYDAAGRLTRETLTSGGERTYEYDAQGNLIVSVDENGLRETFRYDDVGRPLETSRDRLVDGVVTTVNESFEYDLRGNLIRSIDAAGGVSSQTYDASDRLIASTDPLGRVIRFVYDANGNITEAILPDETPADDGDNPRSRTEYDALDRVMADIAPDGSITRFEYDAVGRMIATIFDDETPGDLTDNPRQTMAYDAAGQLIASTDANGNETEFTYDTTRNLVRAENALGDAATFQHDANDRVIVETDEAGIAQRYAYDSAGRLIETTDANGNVQTIDYDTQGRPATRTDELRRSTVYQYDSAGRIIAAVDPAGNVNTFDYDAEGNLIVQRDASGRETTYRYDELGRRIRTTRPDGTFDQSDYDAVGNLIRYTDFDADIQTFVYDSQNRRISRTIPGTGTTTFTYTDDGLVASETDDRGTTTYEYDARRRLTAIVSPDGNEVRYQLDDNGNVLEMTTLLGDIRYVYDELDRITSVTDALGNSTTYTYDPLGRLLQTNESNGLTETRSYNSLGHLQRIRMTDASDSVLSELTYQTDAAGRRTAKTDAAGNRETYAYDEAGRLIAQERFASGQSVPESSTRFAYDATGNRMTETDSLGNVTTYVYDANDRLLSTSGPEGVVSYTYDANGNRTSKTSDGVTTRYVFSSDNRLNSVDMQDDGIMDVAYDYDARGNLVERQENGDVTRYQLDLRRSLAEAVADYRVDGTPIAGYTHAAGLVSQQRGGESFTYHTDGLGSVIAISDENAAIVNEYRYDSFGQTEQATETVQNEFLFDGQRRDPTTGLDYLRARFYDSETGRFVGVDPFEGTPIQTNSIHDYTYAGNDPINASDPSGRFTLLEVSFSSQTLVKVGQAFTSSAQTGLKRAGRIADNLIAPGTQMQNIGLQLAFGNQLISDQVAFEDRSVSDRGYDLYLIGNDYRQAGFQALRVTIVGIYADTLKSLGAGAVKDIAKLSPSLKRVVTSFENVIKGIEQFNKLEKFTYVKIPTSVKPGIDQLIDGYIEATGKSLSRANLYGYLAGTQTNFEKGIDDLKKKGDKLSKGLSAFWK